MGVGIAAIHEIAGWVVLLSFLDYFRDERSFATLVACTPEEDTWVVAVAQHHLADALLIHGEELIVVGDVFRGMRLVACLVDDVETVFIGKLQILVDRRVVGSANRIEVVLLQYLHVLADGGFVHHMSQFRVLHVGVGGIHLDGLSVEVEHLVADFRFLESHLAGDLLHDSARLVEQFEIQLIEHRSFSGPLFGIGDE